MKNYEKVHTDYDVIQSLKFYFMLSAYCCSRDIPEVLCTQSMREFIKEGKESWHGGNAKVLSAYLDMAYQSLPAEFLSHMTISSPGDRDQLTIVDTKYTYMKSQK